MISILVLTDNVTEWVDKFHCCLCTLREHKTSNGYHLENPVFFVDIESDTSKNRKGRRYSNIIIDKPIQNDYERAVVCPLALNPVIHTKRYFASANIVNEVNHGSDDHSEYQWIYDDISVEYRKPSDGEVVVARYNYGELSLDMARGLLKRLEEAFCNNIVVILPQNTSLEQMSKQQLKKFLDFLTEGTKELLNCDDDGILLEEEAKIDK